MTIEEVRDYFPYLKSGKIYFNHASIGPLSSRVLLRVNEYLTERCSGEIKNYDTFLETEKMAKKRLGRLLNTDPGNLSWTDNVSNAFNVLANGIEWKKGDHIILNDVEFPANVYPFLNLKSKGVEIDFVKSKGGRILLKDIENKITGRTRLISISLVQFISGYRINVESLSEICRSKNILLAVDAIQGAGVVNIDVRKSGVDFLAGGTQKWLMALQGLSYFYVSDRLLDILKPRFVGWLSVEDAWNFLDYKMNLKKNAHKFQSGTLNAIGITAIDSSLELFEEFGMERIENYVLGNSKYFIEQLEEVGLNPLLSGVSEENLAGIVTADSTKNKQIVEILKDQNIIIEIRNNLLRFSPHFYNTKDDIDKVIFSIKGIF